METNRLEHTLQIMEQLALQRRNLMNRVFYGRMEKQDWDDIVMGVDDVVDRYMSVHGLAYDDADMNLFRDMQRYIIEYLTEKY